MNYKTTNMKTYFENPTWVNSSLWEVGSKQSNWCSSQEKKGKVEKRSELLGMYNKRHKNFKKDVGLVGEFSQKPNINQHSNMILHK